jgi:hypothetical protein
VDNIIGEARRIHGRGMVVDVLRFKRETPRTHEENGALDNGIRDEAGKAKP